MGGGELNPMEQEESRAQARARSHEEPPPGRSVGVLEALLKQAGTINCQAAATLAETCAVVTAIIGPEDSPEQAVVAEKPATGLVNQIEQVNGATMVSLNEIARQIQRL